MTSAGSQRIAIKGVGVAAVLLLLGVSVWVHPFLGVVVVLIAADGWTVARLTRGQPYRVLAVVVAVVADISTRFTFGPLLGRLYAPHPLPEWMQYVFPLFSFGFGVCTGLLVRRFVAQAES